MARRKTPKNKKSPYYFSITFEPKLGEHLDRTRKELSDNPNELKTKAFVINKILWAYYNAQD